MFEVRVQLGQVVRLTAADRQRPTDGPVALSVTGVRLVTNRPEQVEWVWVEGVKIMHDGGSGPKGSRPVRPAHSPGCASRGCPPGPLTGLR
jgi:hypothetical protein